MEVSPSDPTHGPPSGPLPSRGGLYYGQDSGQLSHYVPDSGPLPSPSIPFASATGETHTETLGQGDVSPRAQDVAAGQFQEFPRVPASNLTKVSRWLTTPLRNILGHDPQGAIPQVAERPLSPNNPNPIDVAIAAGSRKVNSVMPDPRIVQTPFPTEQEDFARMAGPFARVKPETPGTYHPPEPKPHKTLGQTITGVPGAIGGGLARTAIDIGVKAAEVVIRPIAATDMYINGRPTMSASVELPGFLHQLTSKQLARAVAERLPMAALSADNWATDALFALLGLPEGIQKAWHEAWILYHDWREDANIAKRDVLQESGRQEMAQDLHDLIREAIGDIRTGKRVPHADELRTYGHIDFEDRPINHQTDLEDLYEADRAHALVAGDMHTLERAASEYQRETKAVANRIRHLEKRRLHHNDRFNAKVEASKRLNIQVTQPRP